MIGIINYGLGNIQSFLNSYRLLGIDSCSVSNLYDLKKCDHLVLPGVGAFDEAMIRLKASNLINNIEQLVFKENIPILGICVGLQIMARRSEEGEKKGLGWIDADVKLIKRAKNLPLPHMGWNKIKIKNHDASFLDGTDNRSFYFLHSYCLKMDSLDGIIATSEYGSNIVSAVNKNNIYGCQFHPEKSHSAGLKILENFANI